MSSARRPGLMIYGGSFDPPQRAHVDLARAVADFSVHRPTILFVPTSQNPLKSDAPTAAADRLEMLRLALRTCRDTEISTIELDRPPPAYTVETLRELRRLRGPEEVFTLLMGSDSAVDFARWREPLEILKLAIPAIVIRPPHTLAGLTAHLRETLPPDAAEAMIREIVPLPPIDISSTEVRRRLARGESVEGLLDPEVERYIRDRGLYGATPDAGAC